MRWTIILISGFVLICSCNFLPRSEVATSEEKLNVLNKVDFDKNIIDNLPKYEALKDFLDKHIDTLMAYRHSKNMVSYISGNGNVDSTVLQNEDCYSFFKFNSCCDFNSVPDYLRKDFKRLWEQLGDELIQSVTICDYNTIRHQYKYNTFSIIAVEEGGENRLYVYHELFWKDPRDDQDHLCNDLCKDSIIDNCIYRLVVRDDVFW